MKISHVVLSLGLLGACSTATAIDLKGAEKAVTGQSTSASTGQGATSALTGALGGGAMPAITSGVGGNAAGVLQYCIKNNYLNAGAAASVKDKLLGKVSGQEDQQAGFDKGATGILTGGDGKTLDLKSVPDKARRKGCDYVLSNAKSLI